MVIKIKEEFADDLTYLVDNIKHATQKHDEKTTNALIIGACYVLKKIRKLRYYEQQLRLAMEKAYLA